MTIEVRRLNPADDLSDAFAVREQVFHQEQGIPTTEDFDGLDTAAQQFVAYDDDRAIGTGRYRLLPGSVGKVERVAVLDE